MINIIYDKAIKMPGGNSFYIQSEYDKTLVAIIKNFDIRYYHIEDKVWEIPLTYLSDFIYKVAGKYTITLIVKGESPNKDSRVEIPKDLELKNEPFNHQKEAIEYGLNRDKFILADDQGLGKTFMIIGLAAVRKKLNNLKHCLIICGVNNLKWNWKDEIEEHSDFSSMILGHRITATGNDTVGSMEDKIHDLKNHEDGFFLITNIETMRDKKFEKAFLKYGKDIDMIAIDEIHKVRNPNSFQGKGLLKICENKKYVIPMSGTPLMKNPLDSYIPLKLIDKEYSTFGVFKMFFTIKGKYNKIVGFRNMDIIKNQMQTNMIRRKKTDVLDLPERLPIVKEYVEMTPKQATIYNKIKAEMQKEKSLIREKMKNLPNLLGHFIKLRKVTAGVSLEDSDIYGSETQLEESAKMERLKELVDELMEQEEKVVIMSNFVETIQVAKKWLKDYEVLEYHGKIPADEKNKNKKLFQTDDSKRIIMGTTGSMGTGLTLTASSTIIFLDNEWNKGDVEQAIDRLHRIGTKKPVTPILIMTKGTIDEVVYKLMRKKGKVNDLIMGDIGDEEEDLTNIDLIIDSILGGKAE